MGYSFEYIWQGKKTESMAWHDMFSKHTTEFKISLNTAKNRLIIYCCLIQFDLWTVCVKAHTNNQPPFAGLHFRLLFSLSFTFIFAWISWIRTNILTNETLCSERWTGHDVFKFHYKNANETLQKAQKSELYYFIIKTSEKKRRRK